MKIPAAWAKRAGISYAIIKEVGSVTEPLYCGVDVYDMVLEFNRQAGLLAGGEITLIDSDGDWMEKVSR